MVAPVAHNMFRLGEGFNPRYGVRGERFLLRRPKRMRVRQCKGREAQTKPVGGARGVVVFGHELVWVEVADGQGAVIRQDFLLPCPETQVTEEEAFDYAPGQRGRQVEVSEGNGAPEAGHCEAVCERAAEGDQAALFVGVVQELEGVEFCALAVELGAFGVTVAPYLD